MVGRTISWAAEMSTDFIKLHLKNKVLNENIKLKNISEMVERLLVDIHISWDINMTVVDDTNIET